MGNAFVVAVIVSDKKLLFSSVNQFLLNLALADIGNLIFCAPDMAMVLLDHGWILPESSCHYLRFLQEYFLYASVLLQMSIGIERFLAICTPLRMQRFSTKTTLIVVLSMWSIAAAFATPYFISQGIIRVPRTNQKYCIWRGISASTRVLFKWAEFIVLYAAPLLLLTVLYTVMGRVLWGQSETIANETQQIAILKLRRSVVKMLIISMLLYFLFYTPIQGLFVMETVFMRTVHMPSWLRLLLNALSVMSSSANPIVYIMCCRHFHSRFMAMTSGCCSIFQSCWKRPYSSKYSCVEADVSCSTNRFSRSPYVSFRKSDKRLPQQHVTLL
ncbi:unnamed protein product [Auanema sp. JU1783]|nr:unnamed protein product [Auanema sp. JU1783]